MYSLKFNTCGYTLKYILYCCSKYGPILKIVCKGSTKYIIPNLYSHNALINFKGLMYKLHYFLYDINSVVIFTVLL